MVDGVAMCTNVLVWNLCTVAAIVTGSDTMKIVYFEPTHPTQLSVQQWV